jgi:hypothetical protein
MVRRRRVWGGLAAWEKGCEGIEGGGGVCERKRAYCCILATGFCFLIAISGPSSSSAADMTQGRGGERREGGGCCLAGGAEEEGWEGVRK